MTVQELIEELQRQDPKGTVLVPSICQDSDAIEFDKANYVVGYDLGKGSFVEIISEDE